MPESGPFPFEQRSLPYYPNAAAYQKYEWRHSPADIGSVYDQLDDQTRAAVDAVLDPYNLELSDLSHVQRGEAAPAFGEPGGATQDMLPISVALLEKMGMVEEVS